MREQLENYVNLLFAGNPEAEEIKQEILLNTLDRYDDLIARGKAPGAAYSLAIAGIGDVSELLDQPTAAEAPVREIPVLENAQTVRHRKTLRAIGVALYILCPVPVIVLENTRFEDPVGVPILFLMVAAATALLILSGRGDGEKTGERKTLDFVSLAVWITGTIIYLGINFFTHAWFITWLIFPIAGAVSGLIHAAFDLKEAKKHEK